MSIHTDNGKLILSLYNSTVYLYYSDIDGMISQALLVGNFEAAVDMCIGADRMVKNVTIVTIIYVISIVVIGRSIGASYIWWQ